MNFKSVYFILLLQLKLIYGLNCSDNFNRNIIQLISDYAACRNIKSLVLVYEDFFLENCKSDAIKTFICLSSHNFHVSFPSSGNFFKYFENFGAHKTGIVLFFNDNNENNLTNFFNDQDRNKDIMFDRKTSWLIIINKVEIIHKVRFATLNLNSDLVIASEIHNAAKNDLMELFFNETTEYCKILNRTQIQKKNKLQQETSRYFHLEDAVNRHCKKTNLTSSSSYCLLQVYKIRRELNISLVVHSLGFWSSSHRTENMLPFVINEKRINFYKHPLKFGKQNASHTTAMENEIEDDINEEKMIEIVNYFQDFFNARRNIYIKHQPSNELRDIYLIPFGTKLIICVVMTGIALSIIMSVINKVTNKITKKEIKPRTNDTFGEATLWCIGIFTMQGSFWTPATYSGNIILITTLAFALVIFNAYSAFITSVLSVELASIRSVEDLLESNYNIGYVKNSQDETYLRSMNDTQLQQIYLRGYLHNNVLNTSEGLWKSMEGRYGFFASANVARKELQRINNYKCNDHIIEIPILKTMNTIAFPFSKGSPYKKVFDLSMIKMYESGLHKYFHSLVIPGYSKCDQKKIFRSAHLSDLSTAFGILIIGIQLSLLIVLGEYLWKRKQEIWSRIKKNNNPTQVPYLN